ncbi:hypothetical protein LV83_00372 [Algoriphagus yeomjeoni]|uniref:Uncharacterized protein n=1 Tax=Algoriphagus yeomjeoni TaxID=291403 RepID=A0A327PUZ3_9BACT|nr:hypothetical protein LV83_00372 [Algoriphagus yeomjeoni]
MPYKMPYIKQFLHFFNNSANHYNLQKRLILTYFKIFDEKVKFEKSNFETVNVYFC